MNKFLYDLVKLAKSLNVKVSAQLDKLARNYEKRSSGNVSNVKINEVNDNGRYKTFHILNTELGDHFDALKSIYFTLTNDNRFIKFGKHKVIIVFAHYEGKTFTYHCNVLINDKTTFENYYEQVKDSIRSNGDDGYPIDVIPEFTVKVWNMDKYANRKIKLTKKASPAKAEGLRHTPTKTVGMRGAGGVGGGRSFSTTSSILDRDLNRNRNYIIPIKKQNIKLDSIIPFAASDIETINYNGYQMPILITYFNDKIGINWEFLIDKKLLSLPDGMKLAQKKLWDEYFYNVISSKIGIVFMHNLGSFDGYFIYKALSIYAYENKHKVSTIIDQHNKFISITLKTKDGSTIIFKDSFRIFPVSLNQLCNIFHVEGKVSKYNIKFNTLDVLNNNYLLKKFRKI